MTETAGDSVYRHPKPEKLGEIDLSSHAVVEASAGTGKTYTLEHLIIDIVLETDTPIDEILVVTFTRRATAEMTERVRERFRALIDRAESAGVGDVDRLEGQQEMFGGDKPAHSTSPEGSVWTIDAERLRRLKQALNDFGQAPIHTIHSFCQRILQEYAFSNRRLFEEEHVDERRLFEEVFFETLRTEIATDEVLQRWLEGYLQVVEGDVESLASALYADHSSRVDLRPRASDEDRRAMLEAIGGPEADALDEDTLEVEARRALLEPVAVRLRERKERDGLFSYDDMLGLVWENLRGDRGSELADAIRSRFRYALVDEFQDTDPIQWKIFQRVFLEGRGNHLFVIGDPKQAIYGFRGADVDTYQDAAQQVASLGTGVNLGTNYRSTADLIDAYNLIFSDEAETPYFSGDRFSYKHPVDCGREERQLVDETGSSVSAIQLLEPVGAEDWNTGEIRRTLREGIADEIAAIVNGEKALRLETEEGEEGGPVEASDIFVLTDSKSRGEEIGDALERRGVPYAFYRKEGLFDSEEAMAIRDMLRGVARPGRRSWRLHAYMTPFFELSMDELERADELEGPRSPRRMLDDWHATAEAGRFERLFDRMIDESGVARRLLLFEQSERRLTNLRHIFEILAEEAHRGEHDAGSLAGRLTAFIEGRAEPEGEDTDLQRLASDAESVQIMTIHKSKGLEAPVVFLYGGYNRPRAAGKTFKQQSGDESGEKVRFTSRSAMTKKQKELGDEYYRSESRRQMYVAITRGIGRVYLPYLNEQVESGCQHGSMRGAYLPVNRRLQEMMPAVLEEDRLFRRREVQYREPVLGTEEPGEFDPWAEWSVPRWLAADPTEQAYFEEMKQGRFRTITSFTALKASQVGEGGGSRDRAGRPTVEGEETSGRVDREERADSAEIGDGENAGMRESVPGGIRTGLLVHSLLEQTERARIREALSFEDWRSAPEVETLVDRLWRRYPLADSHRRAVEQMVWRGMRQPFEALGGESMAGVDSMAREVGFYFPIPEEDHPPLGTWKTAQFREADAPEVREGFVTGEIDVLFEHDGSVWVADWKTNLADSYASNDLEEIVADQYVEQVQLYAIAAAKMLGISDEAEFSDRFGGVLYLFVRGIGGQEHSDGRSAGDPERDGVAEVTPSWNELVRFADKLGGMIDKEGP